MLVDTTKDLTDEQMFHWPEEVVNRWRVAVIEDFEGVCLGVPPVMLSLKKTYVLSRTALKGIAVFGRLRVLGTNQDRSLYAVSTNRVSVLTHKLCQHIKRIDNEWSRAYKRWVTLPIDDRITGQTSFSAMRCKTILGPDEQLGSASKICLTSDSGQRLTRDGTTIWNKVTMLDCDDVRQK